MLVTLTSPVKKSPISEPEGPVSQWRCISWIPGVLRSRLTSRHSFVPVIISLTLGRHRHCCTWVIRDPMAESPEGWGRIVSRYLRSLSHFWRRFKMESLFLASTGSSAGRREKFSRTSWIAVCRSSTVWRKSPVQDDQSVSCLGLPLHSESNKGRERVFACLRLRLHPWHHRKGTKDGQQPVVLSAQSSRDGNWRRGGNDTLPTVMTSEAISILKWNEIPRLFCGRRDVGRTFARGSFAGLTRCFQEVGDSFESGVGRLILFRQPGQKRIFL